MKPKSPAPAWYKSTGELNPESSGCIFQFKLHSFAPRSLCLPHLKKKILPFQGGGVALTSKTGTENPVRFGTRNSQLWHSISNETIPSSTKLKATKVEEKRINKVMNPLPISTRLPSLQTSHIGKKRNPYSFFQTKQKETRWFSSSWRKEQSRDSPRRVASALRCYHRGAVDEKQVRSTAWWREGKERERVFFAPSPAQR
jgi:hypothetical protein